MTPYYEQDGVTHYCEIAAMRLQQGVLPLEMGALSQGDRETGGANE